MAPTRIRRLDDERPAAEVDDGLVDAATFDRALEALRAELELPGEFGRDVLEAAERGAAHPDLPARDRTDLELLTIDPPGSTDLDQAMHIQRRGSGFRVHYAIADVPAFVRPGSPVDVEARRRGQTLYAPDGRVPLHPPAISEGAASLLPGQLAPAFLWCLDLDEEGRTTAASVQRAMVRSRRRLDYARVQADVGAGTAQGTLALLREVGELRIALERERGGAALAVPDQEVVRHPDGYELRLRPPLRSEDWNAQISLMTGMAAARIMLDGAVGILRTMPPPGERELGRFRRQSRALGHPWPSGVPYGLFLRELDPDQPRQLALLHTSTRLFRGAGYTPFDGQVPSSTVQSAVAAPYAHVTAPLRRLVDRFGLVTCEALCEGREVPDWVRAALPGLPALMAESDRLARTLENAVVDAAEVATLAGRVGEVFDAVVVEVDGADGGEGAGQVQVSSPAVLADAHGDLRLGEAVRVRLAQADPVARQVRFELVDRRPRPTG